MPLPSTRDEFGSLQGPQKAAILLLSVSEDAASAVFADLDDEEIKEISHAMSGLGQVSAETAEKVFLDYAERMGGAGNTIGNLESTERLLSKVLGKDRVARIMEEVRGPAGRTTWDKLGNVSEEILASYLKNEYPQTVALVLSKLKPDHAARVLTALPEDFSMDVVLRMLNMEAVKKDVLDGIEKTLRIEFMSNLAKTQRRDSHEVMAEIFNNFDRNTESKFMSHLEDRDTESAERIRALMFTFEDLIKIDQAGIQTLLRSIEKDKLGIALKGASEDIRDLFFRNMSERASKILKEDMAASGPVRLKDVDEAQMAIIVVAKDLAQKGEITISDGGSEDQMIF
jgi:flagellar motor switch protein FliG